MCTLTALVLWTQGLHPAQEQQLLYLHAPGLQAIALTGRPVGNFSLRVRPSKTAIVPVNNGYLPRTDEEHQLCARTVYAANIDKKVDKVKVRQFFENLCGTWLTCLFDAAEQEQ